MIAVDLSPPGGAQRRCSPSSGGAPEGGDAAIAGAVVGAMHRAELPQPPLDAPGLGVAGDHCESWSRGARGRGRGEGAAAPDVMPGAERHSFCERHPAGAVSLVEAGRPGHGVTRRNRGFTGSDWLAVSKVHGGRSPLVRCLRTPAYRVRERRRMLT
jgi:hypothetical protein